MFFFYYYAGNCLKKYLIYLLYIVKIIYMNMFVILTSIFQVFQEEIQGQGLCLEFIETVRRETIVSDARRVALTIQASTARVILIFCWYTDVKKIFLELANRNVSKWHGNVYRLRGSLSSTQTYVM